MVQLRKESIPESCLLSSHQRIEPLLSDMPSLEGGCVGTLRFDDGDGKENTKKEIGLVS